MRNNERSFKRQMRRPRKMDLKNLISLKRMELQKRSRRKKSKVIFSNGPGVLLATAKPRIPRSKTLRFAFRQSVVLMNFWTSMKALTKKNLSRPPTKLSKILQSRKRALRLVNANPAAILSYKTKTALSKALQRRQMNSKEVRHCNWDPSTKE